MTNLIKWGRPSMFDLQRDVEDLLEDFSSPRAFRREITRLFDEEPSTRSLWREMDRLMDEFESPPTLRSRMSRLFERLPFGRKAEEFVPAVELVEQDKEYVLKTDLPGMHEKDIEVRIDDNNLLTICGERREEKSKTVRGYEYSERTYGSFTRSVALPANVDTKEIQADFHDGVLVVRIPKTAAATTGRKIPISKEEPKVIPAGNGGKAHAHT